MLPPLLLLFLLAPGSLGGQDDTFEMLRAGFSNFPAANSTYKSPVTVETGVVPSWLKGSFVRHTCGHFGEAFRPDPAFLNRITHLFDCFETAQSFHFDNGEILFTNQYYDTNVNDVYATYGHNMNESSMFIYTTFSDFNVSQAMKERGAVNAPGKPAQVPHVSWWKVGERAVAMTEFHVGVVVDVDAMEHRGYFPYEDVNFGYPAGTSFESNPAHEHTEQDGTVWSTTGAWRADDADPNILHTWRVVYTLGPDSNDRRVVGEWHHADVNLTLCSGDAVYPDPEGRIRYMHAFQMTEHYIVLLETNYMFDPCSTLRQEAKPFFLSSYTYEPAVDGVIRVMRKSDGQFVASVPTPPYFATHMLGAYEEDDLMHLDLLWYNDVNIYLSMPYYDNIFAGDTFDTYPKRFTVNMTSWTLKEHKNLLENLPQALEFPNINYKYQGRKYKFAYMVRNLFTLNATLVKLNVDDGSTVEYEMPTGLFPQEPWFVETPGAEAEDDGVVLVQGTDGVRNKGFLMVFDARDLTVISHATASDLASFGLHNKFFPTNSGGDTTTTGAPNTAATSVPISIAAAVLTAFMSTLIGAQ